MQRLAKGDSQEQLEQRMAIHPRFGFLKGVQRKLVIEIAKVNYAATLKLQADSTLTYRRSASAKAH
jgi:hypothetical protein